jgi:hypothetical protein
MYVIPYRSTVLNDIFHLTGMKHCLSLQACLKTGRRGDYLGLRSDKQHEDGIELRSNELHNTCSSPEITMVTISRLFKLNVTCSMHARDEKVKGFSRKA